MKLSTTNSIYEHNLTEHLSKLNQDIILNSQWKINNDDIEKKLLEPKIKMVIEDKDTLIAYLQSKLSKYQDEIKEKDEQIQQLQNEGKKAAADGGGRGGIRKAYHADLCNERIG